MKRLSLVVTSAFVIAFLGASCSFGNAKIAQITMTDNVDDATQEAIGAAKTSFSSDAGTIFASVRITGVTDTTPLKGSWYLKDKLLGEKEIEVSSDRAIGFRLSQPAFEPGDYVFRVENERTHDKSEQSFSVTQSAKTPAPSIQQADEQTPKDDSELPATDSQY